MKKINLICISLILSGCISVPTKIVKSLELNKQEVEVAIKEKLKDPDSAKFSGWMVGLTNDTGAQWGCVTVNAKNSFGGYTGNQTAWIYRGSDSSPWKVMDLSSHPVDYCYRFYHKQASN